MYLLKKVNKSFEDLKISFIHLAMGALFEF
jgi:hypothetical protein